MPVKGEVTQVSVFMENTDQIAVLLVQTPNGKVTYKGDSAIDGVPGTSSPVTCEFKETGRKHPERAPRPLLARRRGQSYPIRDS